MTLQEKNMIMLRELYNMFDLIAESGETLETKDIIRIRNMLETVIKGNIREMEND